MLRMCTHRIPRENNHNPGDNVSPRLAIIGPGEPESQHPSSPPNDPHGGVLNVVVLPVLAPPVLSEGVDYPPTGDHKGVPEFLGFTGRPEPALALEGKQDHDSAVANERAAHDLGI